MTAVAPMRREHWASVARIVTEWIATGQATFETEVPSWERWDRSHLSEHRLVAHDDGRVLAGRRWRPSRSRGRGVGSALLDALVRSSEAAGMWTLQGGTFPENEASVRLHERAGFRIVGRRERLGRLHGVWRDVLLMERRSPTVG